MLGLNDGMRYYVCQRYVRMNLGIKSHVSHKLLDNIDFDGCSILLIIETKKNHMTVFYIGKNKRNS